MTAIFLKHYNHASETVITSNSPFKILTCINTESPYFINLF